jgi:hypothetical protein
MDIPRYGDLTPQDYAGLWARREDRRNDPPCPPKTSIWNNPPLRDAEPEPTEVHVPEDKTRDWINNPFVFILAVIFFPALMVIVPFGIVVWYIWTGIKSWSRNGSFFQDECLNPQMIRHTCPVHPTRNQPCPLCRV